MVKAQTQATFINPLTQHVHTKTLLSLPSITTPTSTKQKHPTMALTLSNQFLAKPLRTPPSIPIPPPSKPTSTRPQWSCRKKDIHPEFYQDAKVYCNGEHVMTTGGTKQEYTVDVWSGNHPFYLGNRSAVLVDADQVEKFRKKFAGLSQIMEIPVLKGEIVIPPRKKAGKKKK